MAGIDVTMRTVRELVGTEGTRVFEKQEFLNKVKGISENVAKTIEESINGITNPTFEVSGKAAANYNIASFRIKNGNDVIGSGSASISFSNVTEPPVIKSRMSLPNGVLSRGESEGKEFIEVLPQKDGEIGYKKYSLKDGKLLEVNLFDTRVVQQKLINDNTIHFYNRNGNFVSEATLIDEDSVKIKKILEDRSEAYIEDRPEQTIIKLRNRSDNKNIDIIKYKGKSTCKEEVIVDGHTMKLTRKHEIIEADPIFEPVINRYNNLTGRFYQEYIGEAAEVYCDYPKEIAEIKKLFKCKELLKKFENANVN